MYRYKIGIPIIRKGLLNTDKNGNVRAKKPKILNVHLNSFLLLMHTHFYYPLIILSRFNNDGLINLLFINAHKNKMAKMPNIMDTTKLPLS